MKRSFDLNEEIDSVKLGAIMDEALASAPRIAYYRVRAKIEGHAINHKGGIQDVKRKIE